MLSVDDLCQPLIERANINHETYKMLYTQCIEHIKRKHESGCTITLYCVPDFVLGRPPFTHSHAVRYVADKLRLGKFDVKVDGPVLHIDWEARIRELKRKTTRKPRKTIADKEESRKPAAHKAVASKEVHERHVKTVKISKPTEPLSVRLERLLKKS